MPAVYNALDIACSSSSSEGLPNTIAEAMACGVHCVVTNAGDSALVVGDTGIVVPPNDPQSLAEGLAKCLNMMAYEQWPDPRQRIEQKFAILRMRNQTQPVLKALIRPQSTLPSEEVI